MGSYATLPRAEATAFKLRLNQAGIPDAQVLPPLVSLRGANGLLRTDLIENVWLFVKYTK